MAPEQLYGVLAEFGSPEALVAAAQDARRKGYRRVEAFTPFPLDDLAGVLVLRDRRVLWLALAGGILGAVIGIGFQAFVNFDYPINVGGRPQYAFSAFAMVGLWITILGAALFAVLGMLALNGLPRLHHPLFAASRFHLVSRDRFFLCIGSQDPIFDSTRTATFLSDLGATSVELVPA